MALVFLGAALHATDSSDEAVKAFQKAIRVQKDNVLAYNGLVKVYEGRAGCTDNLLSVCCSLLLLER